MEKTFIPVYKNSKMQDREFRYAFGFQKKICKVDDFFTDTIKHREFHNFGLPVMTVKKKAKTHNQPPTAYAIACVATPKGLHAFSFLFHLPSTDAAQLLISSSHTGEQLFTVGAAKLRKIAAAEWSPVSDKNCF